MLRDRCFVLSVLFVYNVGVYGSIDQDAMEVGLGSGDTVLDWEPAPHAKGHSSPPLFCQLYSGAVAHLSNS